MKVLHITPSTDGYEVVTLVANKVSRKNGLALIEKDGQQSMTGGYILEDSFIIRNWLDKVRKDKQYEWVKVMRAKPFVKAYYEE